MKYFDTHFKKGVLATIITGLIVAFSSFAFNNASLPKEQQQINNVEGAVKSLNTKDSAKTITLILIKDKMNGLENSQKEMKEEMKENFKEMFQQLREINKNTK